VVTDARGCSQELTHFLRNPTSIFINAKFTAIRCDGNGADGTIDVSIFNAEAPYSVSWSNGATTEDLSGLEPGIYTLTVSDANQCQATRTFEITAPEDFQVDLSQQYCGDGRICPTLSGGSGPFYYQWTDQNSSEITTVDGCIEVTEAGTYTLQVIDVNGCIKTATITIDAPNPQLNTSLSFTELTCAGGNSASASLTITGGEAPYSILWSTGATSESITSLGAGTYTVRVEDINGCNQFRAFNIQEPQAIEITTNSIIESSCSGVSDGAIDITVANGTGPYSFLWSDGSTSEDLSIAAAGTYSVTVRDNIGCSAEMTYIITINPDNTNCDSGNGGDGGDGNDGGNDGTPNTISFCSTVEGNLADGESFQDFDLYPNPIDNSQPLTIEFTGVIGSTQDLEVQIYNSAGKILISTTLGVTGPINTQELNISRLVSGIYILTVTSINQAITKKLIVQ
jgi:hypothetical protein